MKTPNKKFEKESYHLLNNSVYEKINEHMINKITIINRLKTENNHKYDNIDYELYLNKETTRVKLFTKIMDIRKAINSIEKKIGSWDIVKYIMLT